MPHNVFVSYDLHKPQQNYTAVIEKIKSLGNWAKIQQSFWYLDTNLSHQKIAEEIRSAMDSNDSLFVVDSNTNKAIWYNLTPEVAEFLRRNWNITSTV